MKTMPGAHEEGVRDNPAVRSKFDKSHGHGLPAPHLSHPGEVAKESGSKYPGYTENGHMLARHSAPPTGGHKVTQHHPSTLGRNLLDGVGTQTPKNTRMTDQALPHSAERHGEGRMHPGREPDPVQAGSIKEPATSGFGTSHGKGSDSRYGSQAKSSREHGHQFPHGARREDAGALAGESGGRKSYTGGRGKIRP